jgi:hypothetical protein
LLESFDFIAHPQDELDSRFWVAPEIEIRRFRACGDEICALRLTTRSVDRILSPSEDGILPGVFYKDCGSIVPARWRDKAEFLRYRELLLRYGGPRPRWMGMNYFGAHCDYGKWNDVGRQIVRVAERKKKYAFGLLAVRYVTYKWVTKEFSIEEIAERTGFSVRTVHYRLAEAGLRKRSERVPSSNCPEIVRSRCPEPVLKDELGQELTTEGD